MAVSDLSSRVKGYGLAYEQVEGTDPAAVYCVTSEAAERARAGLGATVIEARVERYLPHTSDDDDTRYRSEEELSLARLHDPLTLLRDRLSAAGILSGAQDEEMTARRHAAGERRDRFRGVGAVSIDRHIREPRLRPGARCVIAERNVLEAIRDAMLEEMRRDDDVFVLGEDIGRRGGVFLATDGFLDEFGEERVIDTPIAESSIAGIAVGCGDVRDEADRGDRVCRLHLAYDEPDRG